MHEVWYPWVFFKEREQMISSFASQKPDSHRCELVQLKVWKLFYEARIQAIKQVPLLEGWYLARLSVLSILL